MVLLDARLDDRSPPPRWCGMPIEHDDVIVAADIGPNVGYETKFSATPLSVGAAGRAGSHAASDLPCPTWYLLDLTQQGHDVRCSCCMTLTLGLLLHHDGVQGRSARADNRDRRRDEKTFGDAVGCAVRRKFVEVEQFADQ